MLNSKLQSSNSFWNANVTNEDRRQIAGVSKRAKTARFDSVNSQDYSTEVHQICTRCSLIIAIKPFESGFTIGQSVVERQSKE